MWIDSVDVIRGPQGTLARPYLAGRRDHCRYEAAIAMQGWDGALTQTFSDDGLFQTQAAAGAAMVPGQAGRAAGRAVRSERSVWQTRSLATGQRDFNLQHSGRITLEARPANGVDLVVVHQEIQ